MAFIGICGQADHAPDGKAERERILGETQRMLRDDPEAWYALFDFAAAAWLGDMTQVNGTVQHYNPSGRRYERMELRLMATQDTYDRLGVSGEERAATAEELLARASSSAECLPRRAPVLGLSPASVSYLHVRSPRDGSFAAAS